MTGEPTQTYGVCLIHSADPRGSRVGGIETFLRDYVRYHPANMRLLLIGPDEIGDLPVGQVSKVAFEDRHFDMFPVYRIDDTVNTYNDALSETDTFKLAKAVVAHRKTLGPLLRKGGYSLELRRVELAPLATWFRRPFIQMMHVLADKGAPKSGALQKYDFIRVGSEFYASLMSRRFFFVNDDMTAKFRKSYPVLAKKFGTVTTWANPRIYKPTPFILDGTIRVLYAGRADAFKRLEYMFDTVAALAALAPGKVEFHYAGDGDLTTYPNFAAIAGIATLHGRMSATELAALHSRMSMGLLTSDFEGMPRFVMETLSAGRPVVALHLPQLEAVVIPGKSGQLLDRSPDQAERMARSIQEVYAAMQAGTITPEGVAGSVSDFRPEKLLGKLFAAHEAIHGV